MKRKKRKSEKSYVQLIIDALRTGKPLSSRDITEMVSDASGKDIMIQNVTNVLSKISESKKCDLGYFIQRVKKDKIFIYQMVEEAVDLPPEALYNLTLKAGEYTLNQALRDIPELGQYVGKSVQARVAKSPGRPGRKPAERTRSVAKPVGRRPGPAATKSAPAAEIMSAGDGLEDLITQVVQKIAGASESTVNVKVSVKFEGFED